MTTQLRHQVRDFMEKHGQPIQHTPAFASDEVLLLRARLVLEEAFELAEAIVGNEALRTLKVKTLGALQPHELPSPLHPNLPLIADALADIDYVVEGARLTLGIDGESIAAEVHAANMRKPAGAKKSPKIVKPENWTGPNIHQRLIEQGWDGQDG